MRAMYCMAGTTRVVLMPTQHGICTYKIEGVWKTFEGVWNYLKIVGKVGGELIHNHYLEGPWA